MTHASKRKGNTYERELVNQAKESGLSAKRAYASDGRSLGMHEEVDLLVSDKRIQAKRRKALAKFLKPNENVDAVAFREDQGDTMVLITWWEYLDFLKERQLLNSQLKKPENLLNDLLVAASNFYFNSSDDDYRLALWEAIQKAREALK